MNCQARVQDEFGHKYKCLIPAVSKITTETFASHLGRIVKKSRNMCSLHGSRLKSKYNYRIKHMGKKTTITEEKL